MPKAAFTTLGCKVNQYETQRILESFETAGFEIVPFESAADLYVINSCSVTSIAESKSRYTIRKATRHNPLAKVVVTGCAAQMAINKGEGIPGADVTVPNPAKLETLAAVQAALPEFRDLRQKLTESRSLPRTRAVLKIQDGCNVMCSYCSIPFTRPGLVSRPADQVIAEAKKLVELGYKELVLTGVLIGAYGAETGSGGLDFESLVENIARAVGADTELGPRIRISSIEMNQVTESLIDLIGQGLVVPHLHIPLQAGHDKVLADMNRPYRQSDYLELCDRLYRLIPDISITADIMVGFPTESDDYFAASLDVVKKAQYLKAHVFRFSPRFGTVADHWGDPIDAPEKQRRALALAEANKLTAQAHIQKFLGRTMRVLVEGKLTKEGLLEGLTDNYLEVRFSGPISLQRRFALVHLQEAHDGVIYGEMASEANRLRVLS